MSTDTDAPKFIVLEKSLIGNRIAEAGEEVTLPAGTLPAGNLQATCDAGRAMEAEYARSNDTRIAKMKADHTDSAVGDPLAFGKSFAEEIAKSNAGITEAVSAGIAQGIAQLISSGALTPGKAKGG